MHKIFIDAYKLLIDTLLPVRCVVCKKEKTTTICGKCFAQFAFPQHQRCIICSKTSLFGLTHTHCQNGHTPERLWCLYDYHSGGLSESIICGKYNFIPDVFTELGKMLAKKFVTPYTADKTSILVTCLPLHKSRKRWRGFNQSETIAKIFAIQNSLPYSETLVRLRATKVQKDLDRSARLANMENCFGLLANTFVRGKIIILIDDVTTTGTSFREASKILKQKGAKEVWCVAIAQD